MIFMAALRGRGWGEKRWGDGLPIGEKRGEKRTRLWISCTEDKDGEIQTSKMRPSETCLCKKQIFLHTDQLMFPFREKLPVTGTYL